VKPAIEPMSVEVYSNMMRCAVFRLLALLAVLLMPLGMQPAASAMTGQGHGMAASMPMQHCPDQSRHQHNDGLATCSMTCASALPAHEIARNEPPLQGHQIIKPMLAQSLRGMKPAIPTPPPKLG